MNLRSILIRSLSGLVYIGILIGCTLGGAVSTMVLAILLGIGGTVEYISILRRKKEVTMGSYGLLAILLDLTGVAILACGPTILDFMLWVLVMMLRMALALLPPKGDFRKLALALFPQIWIGIPMCSMTYIAGHYSSMLVLLAMILIWVNDTGAYLVGSLMGRHHMAPHLSPKKTWEGFVGGLVLTMACSSVLGLTCPGTWELNANWWIYMVLGMGVTVFSTWGDLLESMLKRNLEIKDSGNLIPGHGGLLDRIDSLLMVLPALMIFLFFIQ